MKKDRLRLIEEEGYRAARAGESKSMHLYHTRDERMAFEAGYYKGTIEINRAREAAKEKHRCEKVTTDGQSETGGMAL